MSNFERRLGIVQRRPERSDRPGESALAVSDRTASTSSLAWQAAERVSHLQGIAPETSIKISVDGTDEHTLIEVSWDADGVPLIREI